MRETVNSYTPAFGDPTQGLRHRPGPERALRWVVHAFAYLIEAVAGTPRMHSSVDRSAGVPPGTSPTGSTDERGRIPTLSEALSTAFSPTSLVPSAEALTVVGDSPPASLLEDPFGAMTVDHEGASPHKRRAPSQHANRDAPQPGYQGRRSKDSWRPSRICCGANFRRGSLPSKAG